MRKSIVFLFIAILIATLSGCILSKTPNTDNVTMTVGEQKTFSVNVFPPATYTWTLDDSPLSNSGKSYVYIAEPGDHVLTVNAKHSLGTDSWAWNIKVYDAQGIIDMNGGNIEVTDSKSNLFGTKIEVPANVVSEATTFTISEAPNLQPPNDYESVSRGIHVDHSAELDGYVIVTIPLTNDITEDDMLIVSFFDEVKGEWGEILPLGVDYNANKVCFLTDHFSYFYIWKNLKLYSVPDEDNTNFNIVEDSFNYHNNLDSGQCFGMSNFAVWYINKYGHGLYNHWNAAIAHNVAAEAQYETQNIFDKFISIGKSFYDTPLGLDGGATKNNLIYMISIKKSPSVLVLESPLPPEAAHAVLVYGYKKIEEDLFEFYCYDPNNPTIPYTIYCEKDYGLWDFYAPDSDVQYNGKTYHLDYSKYYFFRSNYVGDSNDSEFEEIYNKYSKNDPISDLVNSMVHINGGAFQMGSEDNEHGPAYRTTPIHPVTLQAFYIAAYEVTQAQYLAVMGTNPSYNQGTGTENNPVEQVSWYDARAFCTALSALTGRTFTLPTEAQWEYACRAGTTTLYSFGDDEVLLDDYAWYPANSHLSSHPVGTKHPNTWGLYDMHGNIDEWCLDSWHENYIGAPTDGSVWGDPEGDPGWGRVLRGGGWCFLTYWCRSAFREDNNPYAASSGWGFRVVAVP